MFGQRSNRPGSSEESAAARVARERLAEAKELAKEAVAPTVEGARERLAPYVDSARSAVAPPLASARDRLSPHVDSAVGTTRQVAGERLLPAAEAARERLAPVVTRATESILDAVVPAVTAAASAYESAKPVGEEVRRRGEAAVATLRTDVPEMAKRRWPAAALLVLAGAGAGAVAGMVSRRRPGETARTQQAQPPALTVVPEAELPVPAADQTAEPAVDEVTPDDPDRVLVEGAGDVVIDLSDEDAGERPQVPPGS